MPEKFWGYPALYGALAFTAAYPYGLLRPTKDVQTVGKISLDGLATSPYDFNMATMVAMYWIRDKGWCLWGTTRWQQF